jgi:hypothetical protein
VHRARWRARIAALAAHLYKPLQVLKQQRVTRDEAQTFARTRQPELFEGVPASEYNCAVSLAHNDLALTSNSRNGGTPRVAILPSKA